jgi:hypothetical protein
MEDEVLRRALAPDARCLSTEDLGRYAEDALGAAQQEAAAAHVRDCLSCQAELALLRAVTSDTLSPEETAIVRDGAARLENRAAEIVPFESTAERSTRVRPGFGNLPLAAVAAVLLIGMATSTYFVLRRTAPELPGGVTTGDEVTRSLAVTVRGPVGDQAESPQRLEWLSVDGAVRYRVRVLEVDRREIWSASTSAPGVDLPPAVRTSFAPGRTLLWDVTAYDAADRVVAESGTQSFRVEPVKGSAR